MTANILLKAQNAYDNFVPDEMKLEKFVGFNEEKLPVLSKDGILLQDVKKEFTTIKDLLSHEECLTLTDFFNKSQKVKVNTETVKLKYGISQKGIQRASFYDKSWADSLYQRVKSHINPIETKDNEEYLFIGFNPLIRFIHYNKENHRLIPHYDTEVKIGDKVITMKNMVIYLNDCNSGHTNILKDTRVNDCEDSFEVYPIIHSQKPIEGYALIFGNDIFHESEKIKENEEKLIITTELCFIKNE